MARRPDVLGLSVRRRLLMLVALVVVAIVRLNLVVFSYHSVRRLIPAGRVAIAPPTMCIRISHAVENAARFVPGATCLTQAFSVQWMLALRGFVSEIKIGVAEEGGRLHAHAWLVSEGHVVIGGKAESLSRFQALTSITAPEA